MKSINPTKIGRTIVAVVIVFESDEWVVVIPERPLELLGFSLLYQSMCALQAFVWQQFIWEKEVKIFC